MFAIVKKLRANQEGASAAEYALLIGLIAAVIIGAVTTLGTTIQGRFTDVSNALTPAP